MRRLALIAALALLSGCAHMSFPETARAAAAGVLITAALIAATEPEPQLGPLCRDDDPSPPSTCPSNHDRVPK